MGSFVYGVAVNNNNLTLSLPDILYDFFIKLFIISTFGFSDALISGEYNLCASSIITSVFLRISCVPFRFCITLCILFLPANIFENCL